MALDIALPPTKTSKAVLLQQVFIIPMHFVTTIKLSKKLLL